MSKKQSSGESTGGEPQTDIKEMMRLMQEDARNREERQEKFRQEERERLREENRIAQEKFAIAEAAREMDRKEERERQREENRMAQERFERVLELMMNQKSNATLSANNNEENRGHTEGDTFEEKEDDGFTEVIGRKKKSEGIFKQEYLEEAEGLSKDAVINFREGVTRQDGIKLPDVKSSFTDFKNDQEVKELGNKFKTYYEKGGNAKMFSIFNHKLLEQLGDLFGVEKEQREDFEKYPQAFFNQLYKYTKRTEVFDAEKVARKIHLKLDTANSTALESSIWLSKQK